MKRILGGIAVALSIGVAFAVGCREERTGTSGTDASSRAVANEGSRSRSTVIPAGTNVVASLDAPLTTGTNVTGDSFRATTIEAIVVDGKTVVPSGSSIHGVLRDVHDSGRIKGRARMTLDFARIEDATGTSHAISAQPLTLQAASETRGDVEKIAAGGVLGGIIGAVVDGKKGAVIGAGAGVGAGTILMLATQGDEVELGAGQRLNVSLMSPMTIELASAR